jgi:hypothetical protein
MLGLLVVHHLLTRALSRWIFMNGPLAPEHNNFIFYEKDFVALTPRSANYCEEKIRSHIRNWRNSPIKV